MNQRMLKRPRPLYASCDHGSEALLTAELNRLGAEHVESGHRGVHFWGAEEVIWRVNLFSRFANRVLIPLCEFDASTRESLYAGAQSVRWDWWIRAEQTIAVDASAHESTLEHTHFISQVVKDAIADCFRDRYSVRPSVDTQTPDLPVNARISNNVCTLSLDASGARLHRRGYRIEQGIAPLKETLACSLSAHANWRPNEPLIDLTCGSGTILIEAAQRAAMVPAGWSRVTKGDFAFMSWLSHNEKRFEQFLKGVPRPQAYTPNLFGADIDAIQIQRAQRNADRADVGDLIHWVTGDFKDTCAQAAQWLADIESTTEIPNDGRRGIIVMNPPYGERLEDRDSLVRFYRDLGQAVKKDLHGLELWLFVGTQSPWKEIGLKPSQRIHLRNGSIPCLLLKIPLRRMA